MTEPLARRIEGTTALVTGANRGLGKALCRHCSTGARRRFTRVRAIRAPWKSPTHASCGCN